MLKPEQEQLANEFYRAAVAPGEVDAKTKILIATAVAMTVGCYPWMRYYLGVAKEHDISEGAIREVMAVAMAVNSGRVRAQAREALKGLLEPLAPA
jgi:alkylhydroperoxidase/carboxymuconolactone decarboxylase family protein YurZ